MEWSSVQLRALVELRRQGTMRAAARSLGYTAGAVSQQLAALEREAGTALLVRTGRHVDFTDAGLALADHAQHILDIASAAMSDLEVADEHNLRGTLRLGVFATAAVEILPGVLARARQRYPMLTVHSHEVDVDDVHRRVSTGTIDLAFGLDYPDNPLPLDPALHTVRLRREPFELAVPRDTLPHRSRIHLSETAELDWILPPAASAFGHLVRLVCRRYGVEPHVRHEVTDTAVSIALVEAGLGIAPITAAMLQLRPADVDRISLVEDFNRDIVAVTRTVGRARPTVTALLQLLTETVDHIASQSPASTP